MVMKKNKIMALATLCSTFLSPVSKAHGGTKQDTQKSDTQSDSDKNSQDIKNKKSDNLQEMYNSKWETNDIVKYFLETLFVGGVLGYGGKKVYNKYIRNPKIKGIKPKIEPKEKLTSDSIAQKIGERLGGYVSDKSLNAKIMRRVYKQVIESYGNQKNNEFQEVIEAKIPYEKQDDEQFITWFQELNNGALDILLENLSDEEKQFAKENFKFYSFVWVSDNVYFVIAFAPKEKEINLEGKKGKEVENFNDKKLFDANCNCEIYNEILKYCEINK